MVLHPAWVQSSETFIACGVNFKQKECSAIDAQLCIFKVNLQGSYVNNQNNNNKKNKNKNKYNHQVIN